MRTLKRTLCLVLCLAMMVGLCAIGASAVHFDDYPDKTQIKHTEAVMLLTELGIVEGKGDGFDPTGFLKRDEAAALIVRLQNIDPSGLRSTFTDVDEWAQPYVGWLQAQKIVEGVGNNLYNAKGELTFVDFAAMLLRTLGYDKDRELMTGKTYELGVLKLVNKLNLCNGIRGWEYNQPINRDDAAQMVFNALRMNMVDYKGSALENASIDENGNFVPGLREEIPNVAYSWISVPAWGAGWMRGEANGHRSEQMIERFWPKVKMVSLEDAFGITSHYWFTGNDTVDYKFAGSKLICAVEMVGVMAEYTTTAGTVTLAEVYADAGFERTDDLTVVENGEEVWDLELAKNDKTPLGYGGATVLLVDDGEDGIADRAIVKYPYLAKVTGVTPAAETKDDQRRITLTVYNGYGVLGEADYVGYVEDVEFETDLFSKGDFVLAYPSGSMADTWRIDDPDDMDIIMAEPAEILEGKLTKVGKFQGAPVSMTVAGEKHDIGNGWLAIMGIEGVADFALNKNYTLYMSNGYALGATGERPSYTYYVFKINDGYSTSEDVTLPERWATDTVYKVGIVKQDGTTAIVNSAKDDVPAEIGWYAPSTSGGLTTFTAPENMPDKAVQRVTTTEKISSKIAFFGYTEDNVYSVNADAKTEFVLYTAKGYKHFTGVNNLPTYTKPEGKGAPATVYALVVDNIAVAVFIDMRSPEWVLDNGTQANIYLLSNTYSEAEYNETLEATVYTFSAIVDGKFGSFQSTSPVITVKSGDENVALKNGTLFEPKVAGGIVTGVADTTEELGEGTVTVSNGTFVVNLKSGKSVGYVTTDKTTAFYYDAYGIKKPIEAGAAADISGKSGYITVSMAKDGTVAEIYVYDGYRLYA